MGKAAQELAEKVLAPKQLGSPRARQVKPSNGATGHEQTSLRAFTDKKRSGGWVAKSHKLLLYRQSLIVVVDDELETRRDFTRARCANLNRIVYLRPSTQITCIPIPKLLPPSNLFSSSLAH